MLKFSSFLIKSRDHRRTPVIAAFTLAISLGLGMALSLFSAETQAQENTLRIVVPYPPGGSSDRAARLLADALQPKLGMPVVVENITGAGGRVALQQIRRMPADSNLLVLVNPALMVVAPLVFKDIGYDPDSDFQPVSQISSYEMAAAVGAAVPVRELTHLLAWMKANPEKANIGVPATGSLPHFFSLMMTKQANATSQVIGYRGSAPLVTDLVGGHVPVAVDAIDSLLPLHESGKLRILATSGAKRSIPSIPTFKEAGLNISASGWNTLYAKSGMPADKVARYSKEIQLAMQSPKIREQFQAAKADPISATLAETKANLSAFKAQWVPTIKQAGLKFE
jgi:tripartite-type tricarboxylate transporter receptor subunit TctC